jgi:putative zinc finger/helix-turn-helix YgiT family protein
MNNRELEHPAETAGTVCPNCGSARIESYMHDERFLYGAGEAAVELCATVPIRRCANCGFEFTDEAAETARHEAVCRHLGVLSPAEILKIRKDSGLSRAEFARLSRIGEASLHRWENGLLIQNPAMDSYLRLLAYRENLQRLRDKTSPANSQNSNPGEHNSNARYAASGNVVHVQFRTLDVTEQKRREASAFELRRSFG